MYMTRPLSHYKNNPETLSSPPEGPNSGYLVLQDDESETYCCFGMCKNPYLQDLPFPQNKVLTISYYDTKHQITRTEGGQQISQTYYDDVILIPVLNQPLSSNCYYAIQPHGKHKGEAFTCSQEEDKQTCCFCRCVRDVKPKPLDPNNLHQQFDIIDNGTMCGNKGYFRAKCVAPDGFPPKFLRRKPWRITSKTPKNYELGEAPGINISLREVLPDFDFAISCKMSEPIVVGKWYCPFIFVKEGTLRDQMKRSIFYEMTLERRWEQIFACQNNYPDGNSVIVDVDLEIEVAFVDGNKAVSDDSNVSETGVTWFRNVGSDGNESLSVGLRVEIIERMKWEQEKAGWVVEGEKNEVKVHKEEKFGEIGEWKKYGCYVLVEKFVLKRMDGTLVMSYEFRHTHQIKSKWG